VGKGVSVGEVRYYRYAYAMRREISLKAFELYFDYGLYYEHYVSDDYYGTRLYGKEKEKITSFKEFGNDVLVCDVFALEKRYADLQERIPYQKITQEMSMEEENNLRAYLRSEVMAFNENMEEDFLPKDLVSELLFYVYRDIGRLVRAYRTCFKDKIDYGRERSKKLLYGCNKDAFFFEDSGIEEYIKNFSDRYDYKDIQYIMDGLKENFNRLIVSINNLLKNKKETESFRLDIISITVDIYRKFC